jgi:hypothetical protein
MKHTLLLRIVLALSTVLATLAAAAAPFTLDFNSASGTVLDANGVGTGFTARMPGSGSNITGNDANLLLRTNAGVLQLRTSPGADFNGQAAALRRDMGIQ